MITTTIVEGLNYLKEILPQIRGREVLDYNLSIYSWGGGLIEVDLKPPRMKSDLDFVHFIVNKIPIRAKAEFKDSDELELIFNGKKIPEFLFEDEEEEML